MTKFYATQDHEDGYVSEGAHIAVFDSLKDAEEYAREGYDLDDGEALTITTGEFGDCWIKAAQKPAVGDPTLTPFTFNDVRVQHPGEHPGGRFYWLTPRRDVLVARITETV